MPPASCLDLSVELPAPKADLLDYIEEVVVLYADLAVRREQCREALEVYSELTAAQSEVK